MDINDLYNRLVVQGSERETVTTEYCIIDPVLRSIAIPESLKIAGVETDNNVKRIFFKVDKKAQITDLSELDIYVNYLNAKGEADRYHCDDRKIEGDFITFSWLISEFATQYKGQISFIVCAKKGSGEHWNTTLASLNVLEGLETDEAIREQNPDIIESMLQRLGALEETKSDSAITTEEIDDIFQERG